MHEVEVKIIPALSDPLVFPARYIESLTFTRNIDLLLGSLSCSMRIFKSMNLPELDMFGSENHIIQLRLNGTLKFTGFMSNMQIARDDKSDIISIEAQDKCVDFHDSTIPSRKMGGIGRVFNVGKSLDLIQMTKAILGGLNYQVVDKSDISRITDPNKIAVINDYTSNIIELETDGDGKQTSIILSPDNKLETFQTDGVQITASPEQGCYDFMKKYANQIGAFITTNPEGDIVFSRRRPNDASNIKLTCALKDDSERLNNILDFNIKRDYSKLYNKYYCISQRKHQASKEQQIDGVTGVSENYTIRNTRKIAYTSFDIIDEKQALEKTSLFAKVEEARSLYVEIKVKGFTHGTFIDNSNNTTWELNQLVDIFIENNIMQNIIKIMMVSSYTININRDSITTNLVLVDPDYYGHMSLKVKDKTQINNKSL